MNELTIDIDYLHMLIVKVRAIMAREGPVTPDLGGNPTEDPIPPTLQAASDSAEEDDLSRDEVIQEIEGLAARQQAELVALLWLGRDDGAPEDWANLVALAVERREGPTSAYLMDHPLLADYWAEGLDRLGHQSLAGGVAEL